MRKHSLKQHLVVTGKVEGRRARERKAKTEVSRQLVYVLGGQSEPDTDQSSGLQRTDCSDIKWSPTLSTMAWHHNITL